MRKPSTFSEIITEYNLSYQPGDLRITPTCLKIGSDQNDALRILIEVWRLSEPQLQYLFNHIIMLDGIIPHSAKSFEHAVCETWEVFETELFHAAIDEEHSYKIMRDAFAGAFMVVLNDIFYSYRKNSKVNKQIWESAGPLISGRSVGTVIESAANSFRHYAEWRLDWNKHKRFTQQQCRTIDVIADVLHLNTLDAAYNASFDLLFILSRGHWDYLAQRLFKFAQGVKLSSENIKTK